MNICFLTPFESHISKLSEEVPELAIREKFAAGQSYSQNQPEKPNNI